MGETDGVGKDDAGDDFFIAVRELKRQPAAMRDVEIVPRAANETRQERARDDSSWGAHGQLLEGGGAIGAA
jgi:hypothetical protein